MVLTTRSTTDTVAATTSTSESKRRLASTNPNPTKELRSNRSAVCYSRSRGIEDAAVSGRNEHTSGGERAGNHEVVECLGR